MPALTRLRAPTAKRGRGKLMAQAGVELTRWCRWCSLTLAVSWWENHCSTIRHRIASGERAPESPAEVVMLEFDRKDMAQWEATQAFGRVLATCREPVEFVPALRLLIDCMPRSVRLSHSQYVVGRWG